ncbi:MAG TPA: HAD-IIA family hydrolase [Chloroflexi bacterium]|nr:HAD-IIA family hydrolase [Chloroflexota bacterium]
MSRIAGVVLAAGGSIRFGQPKQLLQWAGKPLVAHVADTALAAGLNPVVVVLGCAATEAQASLTERPVRPVMNWRWREGLSTSVQVGLAMLPPDADGAIFLQCDQPLVPCDLLQRLVLLFEETGAPIVHPVLGGRQATPVLFSRSLFPELAAVTGDQGGRALIARYADDVATLEVEEPDLLADVDTPDDYRRLLRIRDSRLQTRTDNLQSAVRSLRRIRHLIVDMDGVLWRGEQPMDGLETFFAFLRERDIRFVLATNNASKRPQQYAEKLTSFGIQVGLKCIVTSAQATAAYLASREPEGTVVHAIGGEGLMDALTEHGFAVGEDGANYVVVGWDPTLTWRKLARATLLIRQGANFIGTNPDATFPTEEGLVPGNGAQLAALEAATGVAPLVIGKPQPWLYQEAMRRIEARPETTAVVGDRLDTDIAGGVRAGLFTILVLSGVTARADLVSSLVKPDLVCADIGEIVQVWEASLG